MGSLPPVRQVCALIPDMIPPDDDLRARCLAVCDSLSDVVKML